MHPEYRQLAAALTVAVFVSSTAWAITDARRRGRSGVGIVLMIALCGPFGALMWVVMRPQGLLLDRLPVDYDHPDDALAAAAKLDALGEWEHAAALYQHAALSWPEHRPYAVHCLARLKLMQSL
jgi:hypothetical protein